MSKTVKVQPNLQFVKELQEIGGDSLKKCYQCATCSVVCPLSPADNPYPRKEMVWAQWGLKDKLTSDIDIWLCHNCGDCSDLCPRGARPGDLLAALRNMAYRDLSKPAIIGEWMSSPAKLPVLAAIPAFIFLVIWGIMAFVNGSVFPEGEIVFGKLFPGDYTVDPLFGLVFAFMALTFYAGSKRLIASFGDQPEVFAVGADGKRPSMLQCFIDVMKEEVITHSKFRGCGQETVDDEMKFQGHFTLMWSFVALMIVTGTVAVGHWGSWALHKMGMDNIIIDLIHWFGTTPMPLWSPIKILANIGMFLMLYGLTLLTKRRMDLDKTKHVSSWYDNYLLVIIWAVALTGSFSQFLRLAEIPYLAYPMYYFHLISVFMLFAYMPWSKLGHLVYRTVALTYARYIGRLPMQSKEEKTFYL
ncbi:MAG: quinone-interacting membrane-bound oxidoreductase complex subunit QmoC [Desulfovibrio sp.]